MFDDGLEGVVLGEGRFAVRLRRTGDPNELGYATIIDIRAGPFAGSLECIVCDIGQFIEQLRAIHATLTGEASLHSYDLFKFKLSGNGIGGIGGEVVIGEYFPPVQLKFDLEFDHSYLPQILLARQREFPSPLRKA